LKISPKPSEIEGIVKSFFCASYSLNDIENNILNNLCYTRKNTRALVFVLKISSYTTITTMKNETAHAATDHFALGVNSIAASIEFTGD